MAIQYTIRADVFDIRVDKPVANDKIYVDTNAWYWFSYFGRGKPGFPFRTAIYRTYIQRCSATGAALYYSSLALAELAHIIEKAEREAFENIHGATGTKEYRSNLPAERQKVITEITLSWTTVISTSGLLDMPLDEMAIASALTHLSTYPLDGYDLFMLNAMQTAGVTQILTDDGDFVSVPGLQVFTANTNVLQAAQQQNRLMTR